MKMAKAAGKSGTQVKLSSRTGGGLAFEKCNMSHRVRERCLPGQVLQHKAPWQRRTPPTPSVVEGRRSLRATLVLPYSGAHSAGVHGAPLFHHYIGILTSHR
ncbi:hypothetical protein [Thermincola potens]|uniref:hypothetical protein n=2 Tax=Thermincola potens TaxID=863643 RepID=UPI00059F9A96|nr:hypothetical protein [Thermincola potens]